MNWVNKTAYVLFGLSFVYLACSCNNANKQSEVLQVNVQHRSDFNIHFDGNVSRLFVNDEETIVVLTQHEPFFSVLSIDEKRLVTSFGRKGRANGELNSVPQGVNLRKGQLQYFDHAARSLVSLSIPEGFMYTQVVPYSPGFRPMRAIMVGETLIVTGGLDKGRVAYLHPDQNVTWGEEYPFDTGSLSGINRGATLQCDLVCAPDIQRFMIRTMASDCFEIYRINGNEAERVYVNKFKYPPVIENSRVDFQRSLAGYIRSYVDNTNIYLMYSEESYQESSSIGLVSDTIHVFDWDGSLVKTIHLPEKVGAFCVKDTVLFATLEYPDHTEIVRYEI